MPSDLTAIGLQPSGGQLEARIPDSGPPPITELSTALCLFLEIGDACSGVLTVFCSFARCVSFTLASLARVESSILSPGAPAPERVRAGTRTLHGGVPRWRRRWGWVQIRAPTRTESFQDSDPKAPKGLSGALRIFALSAGSHRLYRCQLKTQQRLCQVTCRTDDAVLRTEIPHQRVGDASLTRPRRVGPCRGPSWRVGRVPGRRVWLNVRETRTLAVQVAESPKSCNCAVFSQAEEACWPRAVQLQCLAATLECSQNLRLPPATSGEVLCNEVAA